MKKLITVIALVAALLIVNSTQAQTVEEKIDNIDLRLDRYSKQNSVGNGLLIYGLAAQFIGGFILAHSYSPNLVAVHQNSIKVAKPIIITGAVLSTAGLIVNLNSHNRLKSKKYNTRYKF